MAYDCKHVVAVLFAVAEPAPQVPSWEQALTGLTGSAGATAHRPVGLLVRFTDQSRASLSLRPVTLGARGSWVQQGLSWSDLGPYGYLRHDFEPEQIRRLREVRLLAGEPTSGYRAYYGSTPAWLELRDSSSGLVWDLLADAARVGVAILRDDPARSELALDADRMQVVLEVERAAGQRGGLCLHPAVQLLGAGPVEHEFRLIGSPAHGVVHWPTADPGAWVLTRLACPVAPEVQAYVERHRDLQIPVADEERFVHDFLPALREQVQVVAQDSVGLPEPTPPRLVLSITHLPGHEARLHWDWEGRPAAGLRGQVVAEVSALLDPGDPMREHGPFGPVLVPDTTLRGIALVRALTDLIPKIEQLEHVRVDVEGSPADYREVVDAPVVTLATSRSDERDWYDLAVDVTVGGEVVPFLELFHALASGDEVMLLPSGTYFSLQQTVFQQLRSLIEEARSLEDRPRQGLRINRYQTSLWEELAALGVVEDQAAGWRQAVAALRGEVRVSQDLPAGWAAPLRPYQQDGYDWLCYLHDSGLGGVLADDMGLGKTVQTLALVARARAGAPDAPPYLVVAPASVVGNWVAESAHFTPGLRAVALQETAARSGSALVDLVAGADLVVTSYALFRLQFDDIEALPWSGLVLDEAQFVKNRTSKTYGCARLLSAPFKLAVTGTPLENNLLELWSLLSITAPGLFPSPDRFADRYQRPIEREQDHAALAQLRRRIGPFLLRRTKEQVAADLPPKQELVQELDLHPRHRKAYQTHLQRERQKVLGMIEDLDKNRFAIFRSLTLLRRLSLAPSLIDEKYARIPSTKLDALLPQLAEIVESGHKVLVFSQFTTFLAQVRERLDVAGIDYAYLDGKTRRRAQVIETFTSGDVPVFLISLKAGGFGLNLTAADYCFVLDPWWNPAAEAQAIDRAHRIGQDRPVTVYRMVAKDTIEEKVMALKESKARLFDAVMAQDATAGRALSAADIRSLIA
jgi:superfamily II DNA or RNA helicase